MRIEKVVFGIALSICAAGCISPEETSGTSLTLRHEDGSSVLYEGNTRLKNRVEVTAVTYDKCASGMNRVNIQLTSRMHEQIRVQYRIAWYNAEGMEIDGDTRTYRPLTLQGLDSVTVTGVANRPDAVTSRIRLRELRAADGYSD